MILLIICLLISVNDGYFTGCPMDGCENTLNHFVDLAINAFHSEIAWHRTDLIRKESRGCISNDQAAVICSTDSGFSSINANDGQIRWSIDFESDGSIDTYSLPIINYAGYSIIANYTHCTLVDPKGSIAGTFVYQPILHGPLAGPFVTLDGQILVADSNSFVGIEDSGVPLGVLSLPVGFIRQSRSMSLLQNLARWYLIAENNQTSTRIIVAAETTGSIVSRIRLAWTFNIGLQTKQCGGFEGPILSEDQSLLFTVNGTGLLIVKDNGNSAKLDSFYKLPGLCVNDLAYSESDSTLLISDAKAFNIISVNTKTKSVSYISLNEIFPKKIVGQISRMTLVQQQRLIISYVTSESKAVLLLIDFKNRSLIQSLDLGFIDQVPSDQILSQITFTQTNEKRFFAILSHPSFGLIGSELVVNGTTINRK